MTINNLIKDYESKLEQVQTKYNTLPEDLLPSRIEASLLTTIRLYETIIKELKQLVLK